MSFLTQYFANFGERQTFDGRIAVCVNDMPVMNL